jgi:hypothetical protein
MSNVDKTLARNRRALQHRQRLGATGQRARAAARELLKVLS